MNKNMTVLLRTLLLSTSALNIFKTTKDKKKKGRMIGGFVGMVMLYLMLIAFCVLIAFGYGVFGLADALPAMTAVIISGMAFFFTLLKANSYLFGFREYEMLMALPFREREIVGSKFLYMYAKSFPWNFSISLSMMIAYGLIKSPAFYVYPLWLVLSVFLPLIPMLAASFIGFLIARIGMAFKFWKAAQTILTFLIVLLAFMSRFIIESIFRNNQAADVLTGVSTQIAQAETVYLPIAWFEQAITKNNPAGAVLLIVVSAVLFDAVCRIFSKSYKRINSTVKIGHAKHDYRMGKQRKRSVIAAVAYKEIRRFVGSTAYLVNAGFGYIFAVIIGVVSLVVGLERVIALFTQNAPVSAQMILPAVPFVVYFFTGMMPMTVSSPSLEGKNYWIIQSAPITDRQIYFGKICACLYISVPAQLIATLFMCISAKAPAGYTVGFMLLGLAMCVFSAVFGCVCGIRFMRLDWENEIEVIKQGTGVAVYMFPNMFLTMGLVVLSVYLASIMGTAIETMLAFLFYAVLAAVSCVFLGVVVKKR